jgi:aminopeptidase N
VGTVAIDAALKAFYAAHAGGAAGVQDLLDTILAETGFDASALADAWLRSLGTPQ